jgi:hypothetical protein
MVVFINYHSESASRLCGQWWQTVAGLLPKRTWQRAEKSGKRCPQNIDFNEINVMEKTLNQKVGGSIPPRPTSITSKT